MMTKKNPNDMSPWEHGEKGLTLRKRRDFFHTITICEVTKHYIVIVIEIDFVAHKISFKMIYNDKQLSILITDWEAIEVKCRKL